MIGQSAFALPCVAGMGLATYLPGSHILFQEAGFYAYRIVLLVAACLAAAGCNTTNYAPEGDSARAQTNPNHPRGL